MNYPDRPQLFAVHYIKWLIDSGTTNESGPDAFALLVAVVMREDEVRYARAVNFFNDQLCRHSGIGSLPALIRARNRAVDLGLLRYEASTKRKPGRYFVDGFPNDSLGKAEGKQDDSLTNRYEIRKESVRNPTPSNPIPIPILNTTAVAALDSSFDAFWKAYPPRNGKRLGKAEAVKAFAKIKPTDHADLMRAVKALVDSGQIPKDPFRFLKPDCWREWIPSASTPIPTSKQLEPMVAGRRQK